MSSGSLTMKTDLLSSQVPAGIGVSLISSYASTFSGTGGNEKGASISGDLCMVCAPGGGALQEADCFIADLANGVTPVATGPPGGSRVDFGVVPVNGGVLVIGGHVTLPGKTSFRLETIHRKGGYGILGALEGIWSKLSINTS